LTISKDTIIDLPNLMLHLNQFPIEYNINEKNITRFYIGLITAINVLVSLSIYDIENLRNISKNMKLKKAIKVINKNMHKDLNNTIFNTKVDLNS
jgi:hypothetical protein